MNNNTFIKMEEYQIKELIFEDDGNVLCKITIRPDELSGLQEYANV